MTLPRVSVSGLLGVVAASAGLFAALRAASPVATMLVASVTLILLLTGVAGACFAAGTERAFWGGFGLFGISYLVLVNWDWIGGQFGHDLTGCLGGLAELVFPAPSPAAFTVNAGLGNPRAPAPVAQEHLSRVGNFVQICRLILSLAFALVGGFISRGFAARRAARSDS
jgi:hypothetical protein